jgi:hypothetical protein
MNKKIANYLLQKEENTGWGWRPYAFVLAARLGCGLTTFEGDFLCPVDQRSDTAAEKLYRMRQLSQNIEGMVLAANVSL